jgi:hypothetical protein
MRRLLNTLQDLDSGQLRIIAGFWGLEVSRKDLQLTARTLAQEMLGPALAMEIAESLPSPARQALDHLMTQGGRMPWADFTRQHGELREYGPGRRDREKPWQNPISPTEVLWYRGLIARAFGDTPSGPMEFAFVPEDLITVLPQAPPVVIPPLGEPSTTPTSIQAGTSAAVDDATTILAALRQQPCDTNHILEPRRMWLNAHLRVPAALDLLTTLLIQMSVLTGLPYRPDPRATREFLEKTRAEILLQLLRAWQETTSWNDLQHVPHLMVSGEDWPNDPLQTRQSTIRLIGTIPPNTWWSLEGFVQSVCEREPAFQRPAGDFESWYVQDAHTGAFLQGFEHWDTVDGAVLRYLITGPLHWLGVADLGRPSGDSPVTSFRLTGAAAALTDPAASLTIREGTALAKVTAGGRLHLPLQTMHALRYQIARFTDWEALDDEGYHLHITPSALQSAVDQGLQIDHIRTILQSACEDALPAPLLAALERWAAQGTEAHLQRDLILHLSDPALLETLRKNRSTARYLREALGDRAVIVREVDWERLRDASARLGILIDPPRPKT